MAAIEENPAGSTPPRFFVLRTVEPGDHDQLSALERAVFPNLWPHTNFAREIKKPRQTILVATVLSGPDNRPVVERSPSLVNRVVSGIRTMAMSGDHEGQRRERAAGWVVVWFVGGEAHIASIGVAESERRRGIGELLVLGAIEAATANQCDEVTLEVRESNKGAQALYRKYGFRVVGERKGYYVDDNEDALIMTTPDIRESEYAALLADLSADHVRRWGDSGSHFERR